MADKAPPKHLARYAWEPGRSGNPAGRPKGARCKLGEAFLETLLADFAEHGAVTIVKVREERPKDYVKVIASILPKEIEAGERTLDAIGELLERIDGKTRAIVPRVLDETAH